ncbi:hypothetical protein WG915_05110 [Corynebacterium sp. H128]|uniref:hypothetical protein n=1 Tax=Corynebacterium sp. H128 TaxID=3133427 RepID=UPI0030B55893
MTYRLLLAGLTLQAIAALVFLGSGFGLSWPARLIVPSVLALLGSAVVLFSVYRKHTVGTPKALAIVGSLLNLPGWGSWLLVALTSEPGDPVINITGLLAVVGFVITAFALFGAIVQPWLERAQYRFTWAALFLALQLAAQAFTWYRYSNQALDTALQDWFIPLLLVPVFIGGIQLLVATNVKHNPHAKILSTIGAVLCMLGAIPFFGLFGSELALLSTFAAAVVESFQLRPWRRGRQERPAREE